jgi:hypothetical protein
MIIAHRHRNPVTAFASPDAERPELGFWEIETASPRDSPQQVRTFEIVRSSNETVSILTTDVDPVAEDGSPAEKPVLDHLRALGGDPDELRPLVAVAPGGRPASAYRVEMIMRTASRNSTLSTVITALMIRPASARPVGSCSRVALS